MACDASTQTDDWPVKVKDDLDNPLVCRHCHDKLPSRKKLMEHIFSDVCKQPTKPQIDPDKHAALQGYYDTLLAEHEALRREVATLKDKHTKDLALVRGKLNREHRSLVEDWNKLVLGWKDLHKDWWERHPKWPPRLPPGADGFPCQIQVEP